MPHDLRSLPWSKLGVDIFEHRSHHYLLFGDYFRKFPVVKKLTNQTSEPVVSLLKTIFSVPATLYTDQGTQLVPQEFKEFAVKYKFKVQHYSPKVSSVEWFHRGYGQSSKEHNDEG